MSSLEEKINSLILMYDKLVSTNWGSLNSRLIADGFLCVEIFSNIPDDIKSLLDNNSNDFEWFGGIKYFNSFINSFINPTVNPTEKYDIFKKYKVIQLLFLNPTEIINNSILLFEKDTNFMFDKRVEEMEYIYDKIYEKQIIPYANNEIICNTCRCLKIKEGSVVGKRCGHIICADCFNLDGYLSINNREIMISLCCSDDNNATEEVIYLKTLIKYFKKKELNEISEKIFTFNSNGNTPNSYIKWISESESENDSDNKMCVICFSDINCPDNIFIFVCYHIICRKCLETIEEKKTANCLAIINFNLWSISDRGYRRMISFPAISIDDVEVNYVSNNTCPLCRSRSRTYSLKSLQKYYKNFSLTHYKDDFTNHIRYENRVDDLIIVSTEIVFKEYILKPMSKDMVPQLNELHSATMLTSIYKSEVLEILNTNKNTCHRFSLWLYGVISRDKSLQEKVFSVMNKKKKKMISSPDSLALFIIGFSFDHGPNDNFYSHYKCGKCYNTNKCEGGIINRSDFKFRPSNRERRFVMDRINRMGKKTIGESFLFKKGGGYYDEFWRIFIAKLHPTDFLKGNKKYVASVFLDKIIPKEGKKLKKKNSSLLEDIDYYENTEWENVSGVSFKSPHVPILLSSKIINRVDAADLFVFLCDPEKKEFPKEIIRRVTQSKKSFFITNKISDISCSVIFSRINNIFKPNYKESFSFSFLKHINILLNNNILDNEVIADIFKALRYKYYRGRVILTVDQSIYFYEKETGDSIMVHNLSVFKNKFIKIFRNFYKLHDDDEFAEYINSLLGNYVEMNKRCRMLPYLSTVSSSQNTISVEVCPDDNVEVSVSCCMSNISISLESLKYYNKLSKLNISELEVVNKFGILKLFNCKFEDIIFSSSDTRKLSYEDPFTSALVVSLSDKNDSPINSKVFISVKINGKETYSLIVNPKEIKMHVKKVNINNKSERKLKCPQHISLFWLQQNVKNGPISVGRLQYVPKNYSHLDVKYANEKRLSEKIERIKFIRRKIQY